MTILKVAQWILGRYAVARVRQHLKKPTGTSDALTFPEKRGFNNLGEGKGLSRSGVITADSWSLKRVQPTYASGAPLMQKGRHLPTFYTILREAAWFCWAESLGRIGGWCTGRINCCNYSYFGRNWLSPSCTERVLAPGLTLISVNGFRNASV